MNIGCIASSSAGNCYTIDDGFTTIILECGISYDRILKGLNYNLNKVAGCLVTHGHLDHCIAAKDMKLNGVELYASEGTQEEMNINCNTVKNLEQFEIGTFNIMPFYVQHNANEPLGFVLASQETDEQVLFAIDTYHVTQQFRGITHLLIECNHSLEDIADVSDIHIKNALENHMSLENLLIVLDKTVTKQTEEIYLIHLSESNLDKERAKKTVVRATGKPVFIAGKKGGFE